MVRRTSTNIASESENTLSTQNSALKSIQNEAHNEDIIMSLSNAPENRRARQIFEWERVSRGTSTRPYDAMAA